MRLSSIAWMLLVLVAGSTPSFAKELTASLEKGTPELESIGPIAFGPEGILFVSDPLGAAIVAIGTGDTTPQTGDALEIEAVNAKIAALLGTSPSEIEIRDLAVNPASGNAYFAVARGRGPNAKAAIVKAARSDAKLSLVTLEDVPFARAELPDAPRPDAVDRRNRSLRQESITDLAWTEGRLLVAGLSNEEFASSFRAIPFPFDDLSKGTSVEIYHGAHGQFETRSPVRTFVPFDIGGKPHILAAYTCTPLVKFPLDKLEPGTHLKGTTIAELGNRNRPLDMIVYEKGGKKWLLIANNARGVMKLPTGDFSEAPAILTRVDGGNRAGVTYETIDAWKGIDQLDKLSDERALVLRQDDEGKLHLESPRLP